MEEKTNKKTKMNQEKDETDEFKKMRIKLEQDKLELMKEVSLQNEKKIETLHQIEMEKIRVQEMKEERKKLAEERMMHKDNAMLEAVNKQTEMMYNLINFVLQKDK